MFTKENAATLPLIIILCEFCFFNINRYSDWKYALYFLITLLIVPVILFSTRTNSFIAIQRLIDKPLNNAGSYFLTQFRVIVTYIRLLFLPLNQNLDYDYPIAKGLMDITTLGSLSILITIIISAVKLLPRYRILSFGIFWFFITLLPESSIMPLDDVIFEHRLYLPMVGYSLFIVAGLYYLFHKKSLKLIVISLLILVTFYSVLAYTRNSLWKDDFTLWNDTVRKSPNKARPYNNRGNTYKNKGDLDQAISDYNKAIEINPNLADAYSNRGAVYQDKGNLDQALSDCNKAIKINPNYAEAYNNRGNIYQSKGNLDQALSDCNKAIKINPNCAEAYNNLGNAYASKGNLDQAISDYNKAIEINPNDADAYYNRGIVYQNKNDSNQAILNYNKAIEINPNYAKAYNNRAIAYFKKKEYDKSWKDIYRAQMLGYKVRPEFIEQLKKPPEEKIKYIKD
jgi:tetratricopeptide (TPR) repeat protein